MLRRQRFLISVLALFCVSLLFAGVGLVSAQGDTIDNISVNTAACTGPGSIHITMTVSGGDRYITVDPPGSASISNGLWAVGGTFDFDVQYFPNAPIGTTIAVTVKLGTSSLADDLDSKTIYFNCSTGVINEPPIAGDDSANTSVNTSVPINVISNDMDPEGNLDLSSIHSTAGPADGMLVYNGDGSFTYMPNTGFVGFDGFDYEVCDDVGQCDSAHVTIEVIDLPPDCSGAAPSADTLWPPNHKTVPITINGVTDPEGEDVTIAITGISSNEDGGADGASGIGTDTAMIPAERNGNGDGRTYSIGFIATDTNGGTCEGTVNVEVPHDQRDHAANNAAAPGDQPGDFGCDHPGNYCNAPGHNKGGSSSVTSQQQNNHSNQGGGNQGNNGNHGNGNNGNHGNGNNSNNASAKSQGRGPKK